MIDWQRLIMDLHRHYGSINHLARSLSYGNPENLRHMERGEVCDPRYSLGAKLIEVYKRHISEEIPMTGQMQQRRLV